MFLLDTNVISELRKAGTRRIDRRVAAWEKATDPQLMFLSVITILELETGVLLLDRRDHRQAQIMRAWFDEKVLPVFAGRILSVDLAAALRCAPMHVPNPRPEADALIAGTALVHGMTVVTRNARDFKPMGVQVLNPWEA
jgi:hypothetical protein